MSRSLLCCVTLGLLMLSACGGDDTAKKPEADQGVDQGADLAPDDMPTPDDMADDLAPDLAPDMTPDMAPDMMADMAPEDMTLDMTPEDMTPDMEPDMPVLPADPCAFPSQDPQCPQGAWGPGSLLSSFYVVPNRSCCFDYTGDGQLDNVVGARILSLAQQFGFADVNQSIASAIGAGELVYLITYADWQNATADSSIDLAMLTGQDTDLDYLDNISGNGSFFVAPASLDPQGKPLWSFDSARVVAPAMAGGRSKLEGRGGVLDITFPGLVDAVELRLEQVRIDAEIVGGASLVAGGRVALVGGKLGGVLSRDRFYGSLNTVANQCACLGQDIFAFNAETNRYTCTLQQTACQNDPDDGCRTVGDRSFCGSLAFLSSQADVDLNSDGKDDAFSFGATFEAVGTELRTP